MRYTCIVGVIFLIFQGAYWKDALAYRQSELIIGYPFSHTNRQQPFNFKGNLPLKVTQSELGLLSALEVLVDNSAVILYRDKDDEDVYLSVFEQGKEHILWKTGMQPSGLVPQPILAAGFLNANELADIIVCYSLDGGMSNSSEIYEQYLVFFVDGQQEAAHPILLSAADSYLRDEEPRYYLTSDGKRAGWERKSLVMLSPATSKTACTISVWSRIHTFDHPPTNTSDSISFQLTTYQLQNTQVVKIDEVTGTHADTASLLHTRINTNRAQGDTPIFLKPTDWRSPQKTEGEWFGWWGTSE